MKQKHTKYTQVFIRKSVEWRQSLELSTCLPLCAGMQMLLTHSGISQNVRHW